MNLFVSVHTYCNRLRKILGFCLPKVKRPGSKSLSFIGSKLSNNLLADINMIRFQSFKPPMKSLELFLAFQDTRCIFYSSIVHCLKILMCNCKMYLIFDVGSFFYHTVSDTSFIYCSPRHNS